MHITQAVVFVYDVCVHGDGDYRELIRAEYANPVHIGDRVTGRRGDPEYEVYRVVHSCDGRGSSIHVRPPRGA